MGSLARQRVVAQGRSGARGGVSRPLALPIELAEARLKQNPGDLQARFDLGSSMLLQASYIASVEGA